jgi:hypothetical protein
MSQTLTFFEATPGGRNVVEKFIKSDLKNLRNVQDELVDQLKILQNTPVATLRETGRLEHVRDEILSFRFHTEHHWVRLLVACWPSASEIIVLLLVLKKRNTLDSDDIKQAITNLKLLKARASASS